MAKFPSLEVITKDCDVLDKGFEIAYDRVGRGLTFPYLPMQVYTFAALRLPTHNADPQDILIQYLSTYATNHQARA